jgi:SAM-dependent methyltransferase
MDISTPIFTRARLPVKPMNPTTALPPLGRLALHSTEQILRGLQNLWDLYFPKPRFPTKLSMAIPKRTTRRPTSVVPDSGYASAEEEEEGENEDGYRAEDDDDDQTAQILRADSLERAFAVRWVTGFVARADTWIEASESDTEAEERSQIFDEAISLLSAFSGGDEEPEVALTRSFTFSTVSASAGDCQIQVELNDAPLSNEDHTSVGLQSWGSAILLAERMCASPATFIPVRSDLKRPLRILELGAGTGMLSIVAAKLLRQQCTEGDITALQGSPEIIATDYHPDVLANLSVNVSTNFPGTAAQPPIVVKALDWENPVYEAPFDKPFDIVLAADVVYHPNHAEWIKKCVERLLVRPDPSATQGSEAGGVFWLFIPVRTTGRHEGMDGTVDALFPFAGSGDGLVILDREVVDRQGSVGRADEGAYKLSKIGWANS